MGQFDIQHTTRTVSGRGPSVTGQVAFDTGAQRRAQAIGALGGAAVSTGSIIWQVEAATQFSEHRLNTTRAANKLLADMELTRDSQARAELVMEFQDAAQNVEITNGLAARKYEEWLNLSMPTIEKTVAAKNRKIAVDDFTAHSFQLAAEAERRGNMSALRGHLGVGVSTGLISKTDQTQILAQVGHRAELRAAGSFAMRFPEQALEDIKGDKFANFPGLSPGEVQNFRAIAKGQIAHNNAALNEAKIAEEQKLWSLSIQPTTGMDDIVQLINGMQYQSPTEMSDLLNSAARRMEMLRKGKDPLKTTQDLQKKWDLKKATIDGLATEKQWRAAVRNNQITPNDYAEGMNMIEKFSAQSAEEVRGLKDLDTLITNILPMRTTLALERRTVSIKYRRVLEDAMKQAKERGQPLAGKELDEAVFILSRQAEWELENLEGPDIFPTPGLDTFEALKIIAPEEVKAREAFILEGGMGRIGRIPTISNRAQYDKLASGTVFTDARDGKRYRK